MAKLQDEQEQRGVHRSNMRYQGSVLLAGDRRAEDLREADPGIRTRLRTMRAGNTGNIGALLGDVAFAQARELDGVCKDAGLRWRKPQGVGSEGPKRPRIQGCGRCG